MDSPVKDFYNSIISQISIQRLIVQEGVNIDNSIVQLSPLKMNQLKIFKGDLIFIQAKSKSTLAIVLQNKNIEKESVRINKNTINNLRVRVGDFVQIRLEGDVPNLTKIHVLPLSDTIQGITGDFAKMYLIPYFKNQYRPIKKGDIFIVQSNLKPVQFKVVGTDPKEYGIVAPNTILYTQGEPIIREKEYEDLNSKLSKKSSDLIKQMVILPLRYSKLFEFEGLQASRAILLYGQTPDSERQTIKKQIVNRFEVFTLILNGSQILVEYEKNLIKRVFEEAIKHAPSIIYIDQIEQIASKEKMEGEIEKKTVAEILDFVEWVKGRWPVIVIGMTYELKQIDPFVRGMGKFDREIEIVVKSEAER